MVVPVSAVWWFRSLDGADAISARRVHCGEARLASIVGYLTSPDSVSPKAVVGLGVGLGSGQSRRRREVRAPSVPMTGDRSRSTRSLRTEPLQPATCRPSSKVSLSRRSRREDFTPSQEVLFPASSRECQPKAWVWAGFIPLPLSAGPSSLFVAHRPVLGARAFPEGGGP